MKFVYFHLMPYTLTQDTGNDWPVPNRQFDPEAGRRLYDIYTDSLAYAEECGFDWIGTNEHHMSPYGMMANPNLVVASLIPRTRKIGFAILGNLLPLLNPIRVAEEFAMLDVMSGGRVLAGLLRGIPHEYVAYNIPAGESYGRLNEAIKLIKKAWTSSEPFGWDGEFYQFRAVSIWPKPFQKPHPRIVMSGSSEPSARLAAKHQAVLGLSNVLNLQQTKELIRAYRESAAEHGWTPTKDDVIVGFPCAIAEDAAEAEETLTAGRQYFRDVLAGGVRTAQKIVLQKTRYYADETREKFVDMGKAAQPTVTSLVDESALFCGTPEMVVDQMKRARSELEFGTMMLSMKIGNVPDESITRGMTLFRDRVLPHVRGI